MPHKEVTLESFGLTPEEMAALVKGSQRYLPVRDEEGALEDITPDSSLDIEPKRRTS